jgi:hypothetical protein
VRFAGNLGDAPGIAGAAGANSFTAQMRHAFVTHAKADAKANRRVEGRVKLLLKPFEIHERTAKRRASQH